jgi:hypothetical protein
MLPSGLAPSGRSSGLTGSQFLDMNGCVLLTELPLLGVVRVEHLFRRHPRAARLLARRRDRPRVRTHHRRLAARKKLSIFNLNAP